MNVTDIAHIYKQSPSFISITFLALKSPCKSADIALQRLMRTGAARLLQSKSADLLNFK